MTIAKGVRVVVCPSPPTTEKRGKPRKYVGVTGTVCKLNGGSVLLDMECGKVAWVQKKFLEPANG